MNIENKANKYIGINSTETESQDKVDGDGCSLINNAFDKMSKIQQEITIKKINEMESCLLKLEEDLNLIIAEHCHI